MKVVYCARCGAALTTVLKAIRKTQKIVTIVEPHDCRETEAKVFDFEEIIVTPEAPKKNFTNFDFVNRIDKSNAEVQSTFELQDKRPKESLRKEVMSSAPTSIFNHLGLKPGPKQKPKDLGNGETEPDES